MLSLTAQVSVLASLAWSSSHGLLPVRGDRDLERFRRSVLLRLEADNFVQLISIVESHYIGSLSSPHADDGNSKWVNDMPHEGWLEMARPFIQAFKAGATKPDAYIKEDKLVYWYRPSPKGVQCDSTDTCKPWTSSTPNTDYTAGRPLGADTVADAVFVVALLTKPGKVTLRSGTGSQTFDAPAGASSWSLAMGTGKQSFALDRDGQNVLSGTSLKDISNDCQCGIYNWNAYVGTLPSSNPGALQPEGLEDFTVSMAAPCKPTPSL